eukprot:15347623-Ditylum_brightwellii.AAC.1
MELNSTLEALRKEIKESQDASFAQFQVNMQQQTDNKLTNIMKDMKKNNPSNVQSIMNASMNKIIAIT